LFIFGMIVPLAAVIGYLLASPTDVDSVVILALILAGISVPWVLRWNHPMLILSWNAALTIPFLPGAPYVWMGIACVSFGLTLLNRILDKESRLLTVPSVTWSLLALAFVVLFTAKANGGWGVRSFGGSAYGGKKYFYIWLAVIGYFALSWRRTPLRQAKFLAGGFFLSGVTACLSNLVYYAGPAAWILYYFIPADWAVSQATEDFGIDPLATRFNRLSGLAVAGLAAFPYLMMRFGIAGLLDFTRPWRILSLVAVIILSLLGGFRSALVTFAILTAIQFYNEGLVKTRLFPVLVMGVIGLTVVSIPFWKYADRLPMSVQRSLSILPLPVSAAARANAIGSSEWRLEMWALLVPEIPRHFWLGKGFTANATDYYLSQESVRLGHSRDYELMILSGDYHSGPLSLLIPFGIWGVLAFLAFLVAAARVLYFNHRNSDPPLQKINTLLFSYFIAKTIFFFVVFGAVATDIATFAGLVGLSISLNGGMRRTAPAVDPAAGAAKDLELSPIALGAASKVARPG
jgi:hypothetical protein